MSDNNEPMITIPLKNLKILEIILMQFMVERIKEFDSQIVFEMSVENFNVWTKWVVDNQMRIFVTIKDDKIICSLNSLQDIEKGNEDAPE